MRSFLLVLCGAVLGVVLGAGAFVAAGTTAPVQMAIGKSIRAYLIANPEVLVEAMTELEHKQDGQRDSVAQTAIQKNQAELLHDPASPATGNLDGDVTIVEFSDYQCPYCKKAHTAVKSVIAADGRVRLVYKDMPILGDASKVAAVAALASIKQGKHDAFHDALMANTAKLDSDLIFKIAASVGIDVEQLKKDMGDPQIKDTIDRNLALAEELGVRGTPAFVIGKQFVPGAVDADALKQLIADARKGV
jgi:protein-disulfide isomerase